MTLDTFLFFVLIGGCAFGTVYFVAKIAVEYSITRTLNKMAAPPSMERTITILRAAQNIKDPLLREYVVSTYAQYAMSIKNQYPLGSLEYSLWDQTYTLLLGGMLVMAEQNLVLLKQEQKLLQNAIYSH